MAAEPQLGAEEESLRKEEPSSLEAVSREEKSRAAVAESVAIKGESEKTERTEREQREEEDLEILLENQARAILT